MENTLVYVLAIILGLIGSGFIAWLRRKLETGAVTFVLRSKDAEECEKELGDVKEDLEKIKKENIRLKDDLLLLSNSPKCPWGHRTRSGCRYVDFLEETNERKDDGG